MDPTQAVNVLAPPPAQQAAPPPSPQEAALLAIMSQAPSSQPGQPPLQNSYTQPMQQQAQGMGNQGLDQMLGQNQVLGQNQLLNAPQQPPQSQFPGM